MAQEKDPIVYVVRGKLQLPGKSESGSRGTKRRRMVSLEILQRSACSEINGCQ